MTKKSIAFLSIFFVFAILIAGGVLYWQGNDQSVVVEPPIIENEEEEVIEVPEMDTSNWKTYRNEEYGFEVKYPMELYFREPDVSHINIPGFFYVLFNSENEDYRMESLCDAALYISVYNLPEPGMTYEELLEATNVNGASEALPHYKFKNSKKVVLSWTEFLLSNTTPNFLNAVTIRDGKYYIIELGNDEGGLLITADCEKVYLNFLDSFYFPQEK